MRDRPGLRSVVIDCVDPQLLAPFWAAALGWTVRPYTVPEPQVGKVRIHLDVNVADCPGSTV